ncbi:N-acetylneuraminate synthase family protein [Actibacterium sp. 188UL27-1]|uniref:N-acetylneuraminate synthase family protein n=1 Tax=Actibacterium sp. 188UL27-1 TaxID=2786961 RepID=UPI00195B5E86|nr:N-acetylneuraminate synthase family protein [Actibacterium sp. 188UL27-1]MBM7070039.1 N-acetylneuraminate synthase family protein [Actibacterium sp. 188UL27-1]
MIIAEIGQNHQGDLEQAKNYISRFADLGADVVKFQKRDNRYLFSQERFDAPYDSENSFADTYGAHREALEFSDDQFKEIRDHAKAVGALFMVTPFDEPSLDFLIDLDVEILKVASFDLGNLPFLYRIATAGKPVVLSCGGGSLEQSIETIDFVHSITSNIAVLHCVSKYPTAFNELNLQRIPELISRFPDVAIGLSDHFNGTLSGPVSYQLGARVFEKHVTFDRSQKGTDHSFALEPRGFENFCRDIRRVRSMTSGTHDELGKEPVFQKLGKVLVAKSDLPAGHRLTLNDLSGRIDAPGVGIPVRDSARVIGAVLRESVRAFEVIPDNVLRNG